jgi:hypothetical protein
MPDINPLALAQIRRGPAYQEIRIDRGYGRAMQPRGGVADQE